MSTDTGFRPDELPAARDDEQPSPILRREDRHTSTVDGAAAYERRRSQAVDAAHPLDCRCSRACIAEAM